MSIHKKQGKDLCTIHLSGNFFLQFSADILKQNIDAVVLYEIRLDA